MNRIKASTLRALVALLVLVIIAIGYFGVVGLGNLSDFGVGIITAICPLGFLETLLASKLFVPQAFFSFLFIVLFIIVLGRVFCAWVCPVPLVRRLFPGRLKKPSPPALNLAVDAVETPVENDRDREGLEKTVALGKPNLFKLDSRYLVLGGALLSTLIFGFPVFCLVCPVGLIFASILFVMRLFVFGEPTWTILVFPAILIIELVLFKKWCGTICPLGALVSLIAGLNKTFRPHIDDGKCLETAKGIKCSTCSTVCDEKIDIRSLANSPAPLNNCTKCRECSDICPGKAISFPFLKPKSANKKMK